MDTNWVPYLAGFMDGEGSLRIVRSKQGDRRRDCFWISVRVYNKNTRVLRFLQDVFGGHLNLMRNRCHQLCWNGDDAEEIIKKVRPYLVVKADLADLLLNFREMQRAYRLVGRSYPQEYKDKAAAFWTEDARLIKEQYN